MPQIPNPSRPKRNRKPQTGSDPKSAVEYMDTTYTATQLLTHIGQDYKLLTVEIKDNQLTVISEPPSHLVETGTNGDTALSGGNQWGHSTFETNIVVQRRNNPSTADYFSYAASNVKVLCPRTLILKRVWNSNPSWCGLSRC